MSWYNSAIKTETALWLLKNDEVLGELKEKDGRTCLQLLAKMPSAFKSGYPMGKFEALLYFCMLEANDLLNLPYRFFIEKLNKLVIILIFFIKGLPTDKDDDDDKAQVPSNQKNDLECCWGCIEDYLCHSALYLEFLKGLLLSFYLYYK